MNFDDTIDDSALNTPTAINANGGAPDVFNNSLRSFNGFPQGYPKTLLIVNLINFVSESIVTSTARKPGRKDSQGAVSIRPFDTTNWEVEYFVASDASAIIEHTRQVIFLEDDDVAFVEDGSLSIHRIKREDDGPSTEHTREVIL